MMVLSSVTSEKPFFRRTSHHKLSDPIEDEWKSHYGASTALIAGAISSVNTV